MKPLAEMMRPESIEDFIGQKHIVDKGKPLYNLIVNKNICNSIFYGPPGTGKTTLANIMARYTDKKFYKLNATNASVKDIQDITADIDNLLNYRGVVVYIDELQHFTKKQQQSLLDFVEDGRITLIASTTENPFFCIHKALLSRCNIFQFYSLAEDEIIEGLVKSIKKLQAKNIDISYTKEALLYISEISQGDYRKAYNILELAINSQLAIKKEISVEYIEGLGQSHIKSDSSGDEFYNLLSALQKSIRGSDPDAAVHYLSRLIKGGNLIAIVRRIGVIVAEDIGLAHPNALTVVNSGLELVAKVGLPEAQIILSELVIYLATLPKSNSAYLAIAKAMEELENSYISDIPNHLKDSHYSGASSLGVRGYLYPHDYKNNFVKQEYMPSGFEDKKYYEPQSNKYETGIKAYWEKIK